MVSRNRNPKSTNNGVGQPLAVHIILQTGTTKAKNPAWDLATEIYERLARGARPTAIPVRMWVGKAVALQTVNLPEQPPLGEAERNLLILLVDQPFFESRKQWDRYLKALKQAMTERSGLDLILPVSICGDAHRVSRAFSDINDVPVKDPDALVQDELIFQAILTTILRLIPESGPPRQPSAPERREEVTSEPRKEVTSKRSKEVTSPRVFLCHSKNKGDALARRLRRYVYEETQLTCFFDTNDIPHGYGVTESIKSSIGVSCVLVIWTDHLLESRWCQFEILEARRQQRPLLVLDALRVASPRVFPFLSNMPVIRWRNNPGQVLSALLLELVRTRHISAVFKSLSAMDAVRKTRFMLHPPDIMDASNVLRINDGQSEAAVSNSKTAGSNGELVIYPDPPLPAEELSFLREAFPAIHLHSLSEWTALRAADKLPDPAASPADERQSPLSGLSIALSVSTAESWTKLGLIDLHQDDYVVAIARELILLGARMLTGGDLRPDGLGQRLEALVRAYHQSSHAPQDHIKCYLAWPIHSDKEKVSAADLRARRSFADVECLPSPQTPDAVDKPALNAICYSLMRRKMAKESQARIILGGTLGGYKGRYPGIAEEALESIQAKVPLYIVGGFGGASGEIYRAIANPGTPTALESAWREHCKDPAVQQMNEAYDALARTLGPDVSHADRPKTILRVDHPAMIKCFGEFGLKGLSKQNKLTREENELLATSQNIQEIVALLVGGLTRLSMAN